MGSCLECNFEPDWGKVSQRGDYSIRYGECKFSIPEIKLPACVSNFVNLKKRQIERYSDDSGVYHSCKVFEPKG